MPESTDIWTAADVDRLLQEARAEALAALKASLKAALVPALLEQALRVLSGAERPGAERSGAERPGAARPTRMPLAARLPALPAPSPAPSPDPLPAFGYYVYGVTANVPRPRLPRYGMDPRYPLEVLPHRALQALVSKVPMDRFGEAALQQRLDDPAWLSQTLQRHHRILQALQTQGVVLPMRFCTLCHDEQGVRRFLDAHYDDFVHTLGMLEDRQEWRVTVTCDERRLHHALIAMSDRAQALRARLKDQAAPTARFLRKKLNEVLADEAASFRRSCAEQSHHLLAEVAEDATFEPGVVPGDAGWQGLYRVRKNRWEAFRNRLELMQATYGDLGFTFELTGPWPLRHDPLGEDADGFVVPAATSAEPIWWRTP